MKRLTSLIFALSATVFAVSENIFAVAGADVGAAGFVAALCAFTLWLVCAALSAGSRGFYAAVIALNALFAAGGIVGVIFLDRGGAFMLLAALIYGFDPLNGSGPEGLILFATAEHAFIAAFAYSARKKYLLRCDPDILALERESSEPTLDPGLAQAIESKTKKLLGLRDPAQRYGGES